MKPTPQEVVYSFAKAVNVGAERRERFKESLKLRVLTAMVNTVSDTVTADGVSVSARRFDELRTALLLFGLYID